MSDDIVVNMNFNLGKDQTVADIVTRLRSYDIGSVAHESEYHMTEVLAEAADEIERLREQVEDCENDFHALKQIFDKVRAERDQMKAEHD